MEKSELIRWGLIIGIPLFILLFYKFILRVFFGLVIVPEDRIGLVTKKFVLFGKQELPEGHIIRYRTEKQVSRHKLYLPVFISGNGYGSMRSPFNHSYYSYW
jgi:hypothetical protein